MTRMKILSAALVVSAAIASPVFAAGQEGGGPIGPGNSNGLTPQPGPIYHQGWAYHRGAYNQWNGDYEFRRDREDLGFSGRHRTPPWLSSAHGG
jgi:hypothetical protein